jgi:hypothetical protein
MSLPAQSLRIQRVGILGDKTLKEHKFVMPWWHDVYTQLYEHLSVRTKSITGADIH